MTLPSVTLDRGIHVMHLFYRVNRVLWNPLPEGQSQSTLGKLNSLMQANASSSHPRITSYANVGGKADLAFFLLAAQLGQIGQMHRDLENCFPAGTLIPEYSFLSVTEVSEYMPDKALFEEQLKAQGLVPGTPEFEEAIAKKMAWRAETEHYRLYPELPDWELMAFYPMSKRRSGADNWYSLDFETRRRLMDGHGKVGRKYAGRISQLISGSTGLDEFEWGVTLMAHQTDALKEIVYEMRFDEVSARFGEFGRFFVNLRLSPELLWQHLHL